MKKFITCYVPWIIIAVMFISLIPGISNRISEESNNKNVIMSLHYNNIRNMISAPKLADTIDKFKEAGITMASVQEEDLNFLVARGDLTAIKYNVLRHKYDKESMDIANFISKKCPDISFDSYILLVPREPVKKRLHKAFPSMYGKDEYKFAGSFNDIDLFVLYDGRKNLWEYGLGFNEDTIASLKDEGMDVSLIHTVKNYTRQEYIKDIDRLIKKYDISYINLKKDTYVYEKEDEISANYKKLANVITDNDMTLVVTENPDQLSNQKFFGFEYIYNKVDSSTGKIIRSYETADDSQADKTHYKYRVEQFFNSTIDRNIRFITILMMTPDKISFEDCADYTVKAASEYKKKIMEQGFSVNSETLPMSYKSNKRLNNGICAVIMIMFALLAFMMISKVKSFKLTISAIVLAILAFAATLTVVPEGLLNLYPTVYSVLQPCFIMTIVLSYNKEYISKRSLPLMIITTLVMAVAMVFAGSAALGTMLSGREYHLNILIFRGIKISLLAPTLYTAVIYYLMFMRNNEKSIISDAKTVFNADIKVYWVLIAAVIGYVGMYYILRSGNVNKISGIEHLMRTKLTEIFTARPRTKEFLIGYPAMVLMVYYLKNCKFKLINWLPVVAASILVTSSTNSFCHVFTAYTTILSRTLNGLIVGIPVAAFAYAANLVLVKVVCKFAKKIISAETK